MMNKKYCSPSISFLIVILVGCGFQNGNLPPSPAAPSPTALEAAQASATIPAATSLPMPTLTATPAATSMESQSQALQDLFSSPCLPVQPGFPKGMDVEGSLFAMHSAKPYFYDFNSGAKTELKFPGVVGSADFFVSPDGKWLAYNINPNSATNSFMLDVEPTSSISTGNNAKPIKWEQNRYFGIEGWLDNNQLVINRKLTLTSFYSTLILNPFTGQKHEYFLEDYPGYMDFATSSTAPTYYESGNVIPDPTLSRLVYPKFVNGEDFDVLWDIGSKASLAQLRDLLPIKADPLWSPDGSDFVIPAATRYTTGLDHQIFDWFSVTKDGQVRRLTHFGDFLSKNYIISETRSPDGRYLAFQMNYQGGLEHGVKFFVLDLQHQNLGAFCVNSLDISGGEPKPVWSPDSKYVLLSNSDENDDENIGGLILADVAAKQAYEIAKGIHAVGWLAK